VWVDGRSWTSARRDINWPRGPASILHKDFISVGNRKACLVGYVPKNRLEDNMTSPGAASKNTRTALL
jgi:hypothetical protein